MNHISSLLNKLKRHSVQELPHLIYTNLRYYIFDDLKFLRYRLPFGYAPFPYTINIKLTNRCNLNCLMCGQTKSRHSSWQKEELKPHEWISFIKSIRSKKPFISFWGGEPLVYEGIIDILRSIDELGLKAGIITNGVLLKKYANQLAQLDCLHCGISLDGPPETHDLVRNKQGVFKELLEGVQMLRQARKDLGKPPLEMGVIYSTLTPQNQYQIPELLKTAAQFAPREMYISYLTFVTKEMADATNIMMNKQFGVEYDLDAFNADISVYDIEHIERMTDWMRSNSGNANFAAQFNPKIPAGDVRRYYFDTRYAMGRKTCYRPWFVAEILPNGQMHFCPDYPGYRFGDIRTQQFKNIWNGKQARAFRKFLKMKNLFPMCTRCCGLLTYQPRKILNQ